MLSDYYMDTFRAVADSQMRFGILRDEIIDRMQVVQNKYGTIEAIKVTSEEDLKLVVNYYSVAHGNCLDGPTEIQKAKWRGPDWYFCECEDRDFPRYSYLETLTEKKQKFEKYCSRFPM